MSAEMVNPTFQEALQKLEKTRVMLREKRIKEGRPHYLHDLLENCRETVVSDLLGDVILSGKDPIDAIYTYFAAIRYYSGEDPLGWDQTRLIEYTRNNYQTLLATTKERHLAKNVGQRALPVLAMLAEANISESITVIELGASAGMIGRVLMKHRYFLQSLERFCVFSPEFRKYIDQHPMHVHQFNIKTYLGIDLEIPDERWVLACIEEPEDRRLASDLLKDFPGTPDVNLLEANALGFSSLPQVMEAIKIKGLRPVILSSMMMYQLPGDIKQSLVAEIEQFLAEHNGLWISMDFDRAGNRFTGSLRGYGLEREQVGPIIFKYGDCMEWSV